jgi:hypothetical protein
LVPEPASDLLLQITLERLARAFGRDLAETHDVNIAGHLHHAPDIVIDEQDRHALGGEESDPSIHLLRHLEREPDPGLVDQPEAQPHQIRFGELDHFLLAAGQVAR